MKAVTTLTLVIGLALSGCGTLPPEQPPVEEARVDFSLACPPLPQLRLNATRMEGRLWTLTLVALYEQCANSKDKNEQS